MKERREVAMLKESAKNADINGSGTIRDIKEEVKDEVKGRSARSTPDAKPPSNKMANGETETSNLEDNNKNKIKTDGIKEENGGPMSAGSDAKKSPAGGGPVGPLCGPSGTCHESVQGFVQQQSQVFVFTTELANDAAEAVKQGRCKSMIAYHMEQPATKQFLQKNPPKPGLYGRPSPGMPLYHQFSHGLSMMGKPGMSPGSVSPHVPGMGPGPGPGGPGVGCSVAQWVQQQNANLEEQAMGGMAPYPMNTGGMGPGMPNSRGMGWNHPGMPPGPAGSMGGPGYGMMDSGYEFNPDALGPGGAVSMPHMNLSQNKVPNENLTPAQLERREEQLANLRKIGQMLFPGEQNPMEGGAMFMGGMSQQQQSMMSPQQQALMSQHQAAMMSQHCPHPGMMSPSQQQYMMQQQSMGMGGPGPYPPGHPGARPQGPVMPGQSPTGMPASGMGQDMSQMHQAQQAWLQMQQDYYDKKSHQMIQQRSQQAAMMGGMVPQHPMDRGPMNGPPPPYYSTLSGKRQPGPMGAVSSPTSPNMGSPVMDPGDPLGMFPTVRSRPGMLMDSPCMDTMGGGFGPGAVPGMMGQGMGGMGMGIRGMDPVIPGIGPGPQQPPLSSGPMAGRPGGGGPGNMMGGSSGVNVVSSTSGRKSAGQATLHRAGNPEQFTPEVNNGNMPNTGGGKPPPSYAQAQKRKREDLEDAFKNLQPTPSPTQLTYLNQFEGQELTITKQLNAAFKDHPSSGGGSGGVTPHDPTSVSTPATSHPHNNQFSSPASNSNPVNSPLPHGSNPGGNPPSSKGPLSNSSQTSSTGHLGSPVSLHHGPSPMSGANMRLSHFDPPSANSNNGGTGGGTPAGSGMSSAPATPTAGGKQSSGLPASSSSSMSNITSASLANLAKGVEHLSNQMQQNMMQGGPFHSIQVQGQMSSNGSSSTPNNNGSTSGSSSNTSSSSQQQQQQQQQQPQPGPSVPASQASSTQPVNNTFLSTNLQIGQVNIQNVTAGSSASMQVQQMSGESPHMNMAGGSSSAMMHGGGGGAGMTSSTSANCSSMGGNMPSHMVSHMAQQQHQAMMMSGGGPGAAQASSMGMSQSQSQHMQSPCTMSSSTSGMCSMPHSMPPSSHYPATSPPYTTHHPIPHPLPHPAMSTGMPQSQMSSSLSGVGNRLASPPFPPSSMGNANIQIQPKAPNTIQYLPANPPPSQQPPQPAMGMGVGGGPPAKRPAPDMDFMPRYSSPMDVKNPSSTLQYFPGSPNHGMRHSSAGIGPGGPMSDFPPHQTVEMHQAMMMRGGGPAPQDYGHMGLMGQGMPPGMGMPPGGPAPSPMQSPMGMDAGMRSMEMGGSMTGMSSPMDPMMMGPSPSAMRTMSAMGPGGSGAMDPMSPMSSMMGLGSGSHAGHHYPGGAPSGYMPNGQTIMMSQQMQGSGPAGMPGHSASLGPNMPMSHTGMPRMPSGASSMRIPMQQSGPGPGPGSSPVSAGYSAQYQQFQQQLYSQGRSRQMSPMGHMMGGGPAGGGQPYMGMMPTMPGPS